MTRYATVSGRGLPRRAGSVRYTRRLGSVTDETVAAAARGTSTSQHQVHGTTHCHNFLAKLQGDPKIVPDFGFTLRSDQREHIVVDS